MSQDVLDERKAAILRAVIAQYVATSEPVGSKRVVDAAHLDVSAATVRNEMAALEEQGFISQPHTSAGRVPTDKGYRYFVDHLEPQPDLAARDRELIAETVGEARDVDDLYVRATAALGQLTRLVALVVSPALDSARCKLVEVVSLASRTVLVLLVADTGSVHKRVLELDNPVAESAIERVRSVVNDHVRGRRMGDVREEIASLAAAAPADLRDVLTAIADAVGDDLGGEAVRQVFVGGRSALVGERSLAREQVEQVLDVLDEQDTLARVVSSRSAADGNGFVTIGHEHEVEQLQPTSLVGRRYELESAGSLGIIGPTRMDYASVLSAVRAVADELERTLVKLGEER